MSDPCKLCFFTYSSSRNKKPNCGVTGVSYGGENYIVVHFYFCRGFHTIANLKGPAQLLAQAQTCWLLTGVPTRALARLGREGRSFRGASALRRRIAGGRFRCGCHFAGRCIVAGAGTFEPTHIYRPLSWTYPYYRLTNYSLKSISQKKSDPAKCSKG